MVLIFYGTQSFKLHGQQPSTECTTTIILTSIQYNTTLINMHFVFQITSQHQVRENPLDMHETCRSE